jgi:hypothetical protein
MITWLGCHDDVFGSSECRCFGLLGFDFAFLEPRLINKGPIVVSEFLEHFICTTTCRIWDR